MKYRLKLQDVIVYLLFIAVFKPYFIPEPVRQIIKIVFLIIVFFYLASRLTNKKLLNCSLLFCFFILISACINYIRADYSIKAVLDSFLFALTFYDIYTFFEYCSFKKTLKNALKTLYSINVIYCALTVISVLMNGTMNNSNEIAYMFGNKFTSTYLFILLVALNGATHNIEQKRNKVKFYILATLSVVFSLYVGCATATVSIVLIMLLTILPERIKELLVDGKVIVIIMIFTALIVFVFETVLKIEFVNDIVAGFFNKSYTITGRIEIYNHYLKDIIMNKFWFGYGYNNGRMMQLTGVFANAQNGLLEQFVNYGLLGTGALLFTVYYCYKNTMKTTTVFYISIVIYGMVFASVVEVSINWFFLLGICLVRWYKPDNSINKYEYE